MNLAQAFNPIGSLLGMFVAMNFIQARLHPMSSAERNSLDDETFNVIKDSDLSILVTPYVWIGVFILFVFLVMLLYKMPRGERDLEGKTDEHLSTRDALRRLYSSKKSGGGRGTIFLRGFTDHVLDVYYSIRYQYIHAGGVNGKERRNTVPEIQYCRHGVVLREQVCMHFLVKVYSPE